MEVEKERREKERMFRVGEEVKNDKVHLQNLLKDTKGQHAAILIESK